MPERPYTDDDLRAVAASLHVRAVCDADIPLRSAVEHKWGDQLDGEAFDEACEQVVQTLERAADLSAWAVNLGADGLEPAVQTLTVDGDGKPLVRVHLAFAPHLDVQARNAFVTGLAHRISDGL